MKNTRRNSAFRAKALRLELPFRSKRRISPCTHLQVVASPPVRKLDKYIIGTIPTMKFKSYTEHTKPLFNDLKILNIFKINDYLTSLFMYRCNCTNDLPDIFNGYFIKNSNFHEHCTRNSKKLHKVYTRTNCRKQSVVSKGIDIWNNLSTELKNIGSYMVFKKNVKTYFISHQSAK